MTYVEFSEVFFYLSLLQHERQLFQEIKYSRGPLRATQASSTPQDTWIVLYIIILQDLR